MKPSIKQGLMPGDLVIAKSAATGTKPDLVLELDFIDDNSEASGLRYSFWKVLRPDGTIGKLCDILDKESRYEVLSCGSVT